MRTKIAIIGIILIFFTNTASAYNPYGDVYEYDLYFNDKLLNTTDVPKPILKINEPFDVKIEFIVYKKCEISIELRELGNGYFVILNGSTPKMGVYGADVMERNDTKTYEWTVAPTEKWAGGSLPIDLVYQIDDFETKKSLVNGAFTIAYPYISNEYYKGKVPSPSETLPSSNSTSSESTPAFTLLAAVFALTLVSFRR